MTPRSNRCRYEPDITSVDKPEPPLPGPLRNCSTCGHAYIPHYGGGLRCYLAGMVCDSQRLTNSVCDVNFSGWVPKPPKVGLIQRLKLFFT